MVVSLETLERDDQGGWEQQRRARKNGQLSEVAV